MEREELIFKAEEKGIRLDQFLAKAYPEFSRSYYQKLIKDGLVYVDEKQTKNLQQS